MTSPTASLPPSSRPAALRLLPAIALAAALAYGLYCAVSLAWVCDDAFISFRYADNLVAGHGLVFNAGERVEGYTNFSWTVMLALCSQLGFGPVVTSEVLGVACWIGTVALLAAASRRIAPSGSAWVPVAAVAFAVHEHGQRFATGGLETSLFTLLCTATLWAAASARSARGHAGAALLGVLATMTRPDGVLVLAAAGGASAVRALARRSAAPLLAASLPVLLVYLPYWLWRYGYYGWPFPNTFYAKSAAHAWPEQGWYYAALYFGCYWVLLAALPLGALAALGRAARRAAGAFDAGFAAVLWLGAAPVYVAFVIWVGGDFMFARFLVPITPILLLACELPRARWPHAGLGAALMLALAAGVVARAYPADQITQRPGGRRGVVEERLNYPPASTAAMRQAGTWLADLFAGRDVRVVIEGAQAVLAYYGRFPVVIEGCTGLTDEHLAHLPLTERGKPGHEKGWHRDPDYLLRRGVHMSFHLDPNSYLAGHYRHVRLGPVFGVLVHWDRELMAYLRSRPDCEVGDFEAYLDAFLADIDRRSDDEVRAAWAEFRPFYFAFHDDPVREQPFRARLGS